MNIGEVMYNALDIAKYVINYCNEKQKPISNLKLQKILYFLWIDYFKATQQYLFSNEIYAWKFGPVVPDVYYEFCAYGGIPILRDFNIEISDSVKRIINQTIEKYIMLTPYQLVEKTHKPNTAWYETVNKVGLKEIIPFYLIKQMECNFQCC